MYGLLKGKKAIVTGGAQGIGFGVAKIYAENGADVVLFDLQAEKCIVEAKNIAEATGQRCYGISMNIADVKSVEAGINKAVELLGCLDICCNAAGILIHAPLLDMTEEQWDRIFDINMKGTFFVNRTAAREMIKTGGGKIVNFSSCSGKKPTMEEGGYCATKSAVNGFIKVAALEWGIYNINVNAICPGATDTEMIRSTFITSKEIEQEWIDKTALKRLGRIIDQARVALFLSSELADHITGETIVVSAGEMMTQ
jgi:NAD(P)-dependent dehydrogenase (short-subunit alcohol dehydrogenase family)